ncbi:MAG: glutamine synthetase family protein [candidate division WOR-3 bacterium]
MKQLRTAETRRVLARVTRDRIHFVQLWFVDVLGFLKGITAPAQELPRVLDDGMNFDGSSVEGFARIEESDMTIRPDPTTFAMLPWEIQGSRAARFFCDVVTPTGRPFAADPRWVLRRVLERARRLGFKCLVGAEMEFFLFRGSTGTEPLDRSGYFDLTPAHVAETVRHEIIDAVEKLGILVEYSHHEVSESQHEIDLRYDEALRTADNIITTRFVARQIAQRHGIHATFMPKPVFGVNGSGMHLHLSLFRNSTNAFYASNKPMLLSDTARRFIAGLLQYAPELTVVTNQWVNSYKRLVPGYEAPVYVSWAQMNRSALCRVPAFDPKRRTAARVEYRASDAACNPYLAIAVLLAAGLDGIERGMRLGSPTSDNIFRLTEEERAAAGITCLPKDLSDAIRIAEGGTFLRDVLGEELFGYFIRNKRMEWDEYKAQVTQFELERYLPIL